MWEVARDALLLGAREERERSQARRLSWSPGGDV